MGAVTSQLGQPNLKVTNSPVFKHNSELEKQKTQPKILVSINKDNTVRISEGKSIATQTPRGGYELNETEDNVMTKDKENEKETMMKVNRIDRSVQTDIRLEDSHKEERRSRADDNQIIIPPMKFEEEKETVNRSDNLQEENQDTFRSTGIEVGQSEHEATEADDWADIVVQRNKEEKECISKNDNLQQENQDTFRSTSIEIGESENETGNTDCWFDIGVQTDDDFDNEHLGPRIAWASKSVDSAKSLDTTLKEAISTEEKETDTQTECNSHIPPRPFEQLSLERYGKYKVRLSDEKEKCIISSATFLETGDAVIIDRSNQNIKFVDKKFQYISSYDLSAKPWAVCARGIDVYVTMGNTKIQHLTVDNMIIDPVEVFEIKGRCLGICVFGKHLAVGLQVGEICLLDFKGEREGVIQLPTFNGKSCNPWHLTVTSEDNIIVTDSDAGALYCVNNKSELVFTFKGLGSPRATAIDSEGNILVTGRDKETDAVVTILHKDVELRHMLHIEQQPEMKSRTLMTWELLEFVPYCICFRKDRVVVLGGIQESLKIMRIL